MRVNARNSGTDCFQPPNRKPGKYDENLGGFAHFMGKTHGVHHVSHPPAAT